MWKRILPIDYEELADHLLAGYAMDCKDWPAEPFDFQMAKNVLIDHVEAIMEDGECCADDNLTDLLFKNHIHGAVKNIHVTSLPGTVVFRDGHSLKLPLVIIELEMQGDLPYGNPESFTW